MGAKIFHAFRSSANTSASLPIYTPRSAQYSSTKEMIEVPVEGAQELGLPDYSRMHYRVVVRVTGYNARRRTGENHLRYGMQIRQIFGNFGVG